MCICNVLGNPVALDITQAEPLLDNITPDAFLADKVYDADRLIDRLIQRETDFAFYREQSLVERFFNELKKLSRYRNPLK